MSNVDCFRRRLTIVPRAMLLLMGFCTLLQCAATEDYAAAQRLELLTREDVFEFRHRYPGGIIMQCYIESLSESEYAMRPGLFAGDIWIRVEDIIWAGPEEAMRKEVASPFGALGRVLKGVLSAASILPSEGGTHRVIFLMSPSRLSTRLAPGRSLVIGVTPTFKVPRLRCIWRRGEQAHYIEEG